MPAPERTSRIKSELRAARDARAAGDEGKARVCARRAAGWAIREHLRDRGVYLNTPSAFEHIRYLRAQGENPARLDRALGRLLHRVEKGPVVGQSHWPLEVDLVEEAEWLAKELLGLEFD